MREKTPVTINRRLRHTYTEPKNYYKEDFYKPSAKMLHPITYKNAVVKPKPRQVQLPPLSINPDVTMSNVSTDIKAFNTDNYLKDITKRSRSSSADTARLKNESQASMRSSI